MAYRCIFCGKQFTNPMDSDTDICLARPYQPAQAGAMLGNPHILSFFGQYLGKTADVIIGDELAPGEGEGGQPPATQPEGIDWDAHDRFMKGLR